MPDYLGGPYRAGEFQQVAIVPLGSANTPGGILAWQNPAGVEVIVTGVLVRFTAGLAAGNLVPIPADGGPSATVAAVGGAGPAVSLPLVPTLDPDEASVPFVLAPNHYYLLSRPAPTWSGAADPPATELTTQTYNGGGASGWYHNTTDDSYFLLQPNGVSYDGGTDTFTYTWQPVPFSVADLAGFAYLYYHPAQ